MGGSTLLLLLSPPGSPGSGSSGDATSYTLTGPRSGAAGVASSAFTVSPVGGAYTGTVTITVAGAGLSDPVVLSFSGSTPQTFTITPAEAGQVRLAASASPALGMNPAALVYAATGATPGTAAAAVGLGSLATVYCTDEHLVIRARSDFLALAPSDWVVAKGTAAVIDSGDLWTLRTSIDLEGQGLAAGHVVRLFGPNNSDAQRLYTVEGRVYAVESVDGADVTLRNVGQPAKLGSPPGPPGGLENVSFESRTLGPAIEEATYEIDQLEGVDPDVPGRRPSDLTDPRALRNLCVLWTLFNRYVDAARSNSGDFAMKVKSIGDERDRARDRLVLRWGAKGCAAPPTTFAGMARITR